MLRNIVKFDEEKCNGCGLCARACKESAIAIVNGKAKLIRDDYCDGLGACLPHCPQDAISFETREAAAYDEEAVKANQQKQKTDVASNGAAANAGKAEPERIVLTPPASMAPPPGGCPGSRMREIKRNMAEGGMSLAGAAATGAAPVAAGATATAMNAFGAEPQSRLVNWPVQIKLAPIQAPYFAGAKLLIAADCTAYSFANFHEHFIKGRVALIGCPKLDDIDYSEKLTQIIAKNDIKSVTIVRMEVPCCGGLSMAAQKALQDSGKFIPWQVVTISIDGRILDE